MNKEDGQKTNKKLHLQNRQHLQVLCPIAKNLKKREGPNSSGRQFGAFVFAIMCSRFDAPTQHVITTV